MFQSGVTLLQSGVAITKRGKYYYKVEQVLGQVIYYKVGQSLLQGGAGSTKWDNFIKTWSRYYKVGEYVDQGYDKEVIRNLLLCTIPLKLGGEMFTNRVKDMLK